MLFATEVALPDVFQAGVFSPPAEANVLSPLKNVEDDAVPEPSLAVAIVPAVILLAFKLGTLASDKVPEVILAVSKFGISAESKEILALSKVPEVILVAGRLGISAASKSIAAFLILIIAILFYYLAVHGILFEPTKGADANAM